MNGTNGANGIHGISGHHESPMSPTMSSSSVRHYSFRSSSMNGTSNSQSSNLYHIRNTAQSLEKKGSVELGTGVFEWISSTSFINLVEYIGKERLQSLPHKGGKWDKVLIRALYFAEQQHNFDKVMKGFGADDSSAANIGYGFCKLLLELGHENASALERAFAILYKHALEVAGLLHRTEVVMTTPEIREQLCLMYGDLLTLTSAVGTRYYKAVHGMGTSRISLDMNDVCGSIIESFRSRQKETSELIWSHQAQIGGVDMERGVSVKTVQRWLGSNDPVLSTLSQDHTSHLIAQAEFTCLWFQKPLSNFIHGDSKVMAVTGEAGSGKSVLAASVVERLQRPLGRELLSTLFHSISGSTPSAATPVQVLKSLLEQILKLRLGNMQTYNAIAQAYEDCRSCADATTYENHLWTALEEAFKKPLEHARDLVVVVDGLDELQGGKTVTQAFFERLAEIVGDGKRVKLIALAQNLSMPSGMNTAHIAMVSDNLHDDIHAVVLKSLMHSRQLTSKPGPEQEQILNRIARTANGSFVWATLASQWLAGQTSSDDFNKTIETLVKSKVPIQELVQRLVSRHELQPTTKTVLPWILYAERPLSVSDIQTILSVGGQNSHVEKMDVHSILQTFAPLLHLHDGIIRFRHPELSHAVHNLVETGKIEMSTESNQADLLVRALDYARLTLRDDADPTFDDYDADSLEASLKENPFLGYVLHYWIIQLLRIPEQKRPKNLLNVLPNTAVFPLMERTLWTQELPLSRHLDLSKSALQIRQTNLRELSPALLQSRINTAAVYEMIGRPNDAAPLYYWSTKASRNLLSNYHPLPVELGYRYLRITSGNLESKRSEKMTYREEVFKILIDVLVRQYGKTSSQVIEIRTQLAQFYEYIQEESHAAEMYQLIHNGAIQSHGKESSQARDVSDRLKVVVGKSTHDQAIRTRDSIFDDEEDKQDDEDFDIATIHRHLQNAKTEQDYVWLWQKLSAHCRTTSNVDYHAKNIDTAVAYSKYLATQKRSSEASAVLSSVAREYQSNEVSFSDQIVSRLTETASYMRQIGEYAAALSILKQTSHIYQSLRREDSHQALEIHRQISTVTSELVDKSSPEAHGDILEEVFRTSIKNHSKPVDAKLIAIGMKLIQQHIASSNNTEALELIQLVLHRTWPSFLSSPASEVEMTTTFPNESIQCVENMAQCYSRQRRQENIETTLVKLFHATLSPSTIDFALLKKVEQLLIDQYDKNHKSDKAITVLQKSLQARKNHLGPTHDDTIKTLYDLGQRCHAKSRLYPFWVDYYQQIVTYLNKDPKFCQPKALEAAIIVANTFWDDGRYSDAVPVFSTLWQTFTQKPKEYPQFSQVEFVERLYSRYYESLEQIGARFDTLYQITTQYRTTCITIFGAQAAVTVQATLALARVCHSSDRHTSEALGYYEEASNHSNDKSEAKSEIKHALTMLYSRQIINSSSTEMKSETVERARVRSMEQYQASSSQYGYAHHSTLTQLHELVTLYAKQKKTEAITKELTTASTSVIKKETSSVKMIEAAESIVASFRASGTIEYCSKLVVELHRQVVAKDASNAATFGFDVTKLGRSVLPFIAATEYRLATDKTVSFSQLMADLTLEYLLYEDYRHQIQTNASLQTILLSASGLRAFLAKVNKHQQVNRLDEEVGALFVSRDGGKMNLLSKSSARIFMQAIMEYCGTHRNASFIKAIVLASNTRLEQLMAAEQYKEAYDIANLAFEFALENEGYSGPRGISYGFKLASNLAGIDSPKKCSDGALRARMLKLSNEIAKKIIDVCKKQQINFAEIQLTEMNRLVILLGEQEDYATLEWLLTTLWSTREAQRSWDSDVLFNLGKRLISARFLAGHPIKALRLCEDITYNMRRTHGTADSSARDMNTLLAQLYTSVGQWTLQSDPKDKANVELANQYFAKALAVHEETLRYFIDEDGDGLLGDDEDLDSTGAILAEHGITLSNGSLGNAHVRSAANEGAGARKHIDLLKLAYQRLGSWPKSSSDYERLVQQVQQDFPTETKDVASVQKWSAKGFGSGKAESEDGVFQKGSWQLVNA